MSDLKDRAWDGVQENVETTMSADASDLYIQCDRCGKRTLNETNLCRGCEARKYNGAAHEKDKRIIKSLRKELAEKTAALKLHREFVSCFQPTAHMLKEVECLEGVVRRGSPLHKLWQKIYLEENPSDY